MSIKVQSAFDMGLSGQGILVGHIDTGIDMDHPEFAGRIHPDSIDVVTGLPFTGDVPGDQHGTLTAGVMVAAKDGVDFHGVAFNATIISLKVNDLTFPCTGASCDITYDALADALDIVVASGAKVVNMATGKFESITPRFAASVRAALEAGVTLVISAGNFGFDDPNPTAVESGQMVLPTDTGAVIAAVATGLDDQFASWSNRAGVAAEFTLAAPGVGVRTTVQNGLYGTGDGTSLSAPFIVGAIALLMEAFPNLTSREITEILFATATDLEAPGVDIVSGHGLLNVEAAFQPLGMTNVAVIGTTGISFVPVDGSGMIVGDAFGDAFAGSFTDVLMLDGYDRSFFIDFSDKMAPRRLGLGLASTFDSARAHGGFSLALGEATLGLSYYDRFRDQRHLALALPASAQTTMSIERPAFNFKTKGPLGFDFHVAYGLAPQYVLAEQQENRSTSGFLIPGLRLMDGMGIDRARATFAVSRALDAKSRISFATTRSRYDLRAVAGLLGTPNGVAESVTTMMRIERDWGKAHLALSSGALIEKGSVLGTLSSGALSLGRGATTLFSDISAHYTTKGGLSLMARAAGGFTRVQGHSGSLIDDISSLTSLSFGAAASQTRIFNKSDRLGLAFSSPLRIESGRLGLNLPSGRDYQADQILFTASSNSLRPSARELNFELSYAWTPRPTTALELNLVHQINPGHSNRFGNNSAIVLRSRTRF